MLRDRCGERPMLLAGMIGSNRGWIEAPYLDCPTTIDRLAARVVAVDGSDIHIVPGVCDRTFDRVDVMRGEEVQLLGALAAGLIGSDMPACHPGTHAKWARLEQGTLAAFKTVMTGEMFALLSRHSLLAGPLKGEVAPDAAFQEGVRAALERRELLADLFSIRARTLLGTLAPEDVSSFGSGLLVGTDVAIGLDFIPGGAVALIGDPALTRLYACALALTGRQSQRINGEDAFLAGIKAIAERM
jgi:2-dehydro-3-deoxygalactonokinase